MRLQINSSFLCHTIKKLKYLKTRRHAISTTILMGIVFLTLNSGCKKFVQIPEAPNQITSSAVFADSADATAAVLGIYVSMSNFGNLSFANGGVTIYTGLASDELYSTTGNTNEQQFYTNAISASNNANNGSLWSYAYTYIYQANACIEGINASNGLSVTLKNQLTGEAKIVRAFLYFNLLNLFGEVPLVTTTSYATNAILPRVTTDSIYTQVIADLISAENLLTVNYPTNGRVRPNQYTAMALLSKVYLYRSQWQNAETISSQIINSGIYSLVTDLNSVFLAGSNEAIWQLEPTYQGYETNEGYYFIPSDSTVEPSYVISNYILTAFETGDQRRYTWLDSNIVNGQPYYYPYKYKLGYDANTTPSEDYMVFRLAEQYLIRAEAEAQGAGNGLSSAISDLNIIRNRAGLPNTTASLQPALLNAIYHERQVELFCEWGNRWYDLKRTGIVNTVMSTNGVCAAKGGSWNADWQLFPIPLVEIEDNPFLSQNPGY